MRYNPKRHRLPPFAASGILLVDKPAEWTSFDVVNCVRNRFNIPKVGHCGTLDPMATGLLVLVLGKFASQSAKLTGDNKTYQATLKLGITTDSQDITGTVLSENAWSTVTEDSVRKAVMAKLGKSKQLPPMVSAVKKDGQRLYELARKGIEIEREPRDIEIFKIDISRIELPEVDFTAECSKGTYIRTLCADIGAELGCGGTLAALRRIRCGRFDIADALSMDTLKTMEQEELTDYVIDFLRKLTVL